MLSAEAGLKTAASEEPEVQGQSQDGSGPGTGNHLLSCP